MDAKVALIVVDAQHDFTRRKGVLAKDVVGNNRVILKCNSLLQANAFFMKIASMDAHPEGHISFSEVPNFVDTFPEHCVNTSSGANFDEQLEDFRFTHIFKKGLFKDVDAFSIFKDKTGRDVTFASACMEAAKPDKIILCGFILEYCVKATALDLLDWFKGELIIAFDATASLSDHNDSIMKELQQYNIKFMKCEEILKT